MNLNFDFFAEHKYAICENVLENAVLQDLVSTIRYLHQNSQLKKAAIGRGDSQKISNTQRGDFILWLDPQGPTPWVKSIFEFLGKLKSTLNREFFLSLQDVESHVTVYPAHAHYEKHVDQFKKESPLQKVRKISFILYLNPNWQKEHGGELVLYNPQEPNSVLTTVDPCFGRCIYFRSDLFPHEVRPTQQERISLTAWFLG